MKAAEPATLALLQTKPDAFLAYRELQSLSGNRVPIQTECPTGKRCTAGELEEIITDFPEVCGRAQRFSIEADAQGAHRDKSSSRYARPHDQRKRQESADRLALDRCRHYSCGMISEFHLLSDKVARLAELTHALRRENAQLRMEMAALLAENTDLDRRVQEAALRVSALLDKLPVAEHENQEAA